MNAKAPQPSWKYFYSFILAIAFSFIIFACTNNVQKTKQPAEAPYVYYFERDGHPTVKNTGQTCRNLIIQNFEILVKDMAKAGATPVAYEDLYKYYDNHKKTVTDSIWTAVDMPMVLTTIKDISNNRDLKGRVFGRATAEVVHKQMRRWCKTIADNAQNSSKLGNYTVYIEEETGLDALQMFNLTALGKIMWSHALNSYFVNVEKDYNDTVVSHPNVDWLYYTWMEHHLDEVFGYYGAAGNFHDFTDKEVVAYANGGNYKDNMTVDGQLDFRTEYNFIFARLAAQRDLTSQTHTDFSRTIFDAFYEARVAIVAKDYEKLVARKTVILDNWEKVVAATAIHHLNAVIKEMTILQKEPATSPEFFYRNWAEMFKYTEMLQYNYANRFLQYQTVLDSIYTNTAIPFPKAIVEDTSKIESYTNGLLEVRAMLKKVYVFSEADVENW